MSFAEVVAVALISAGSGLILLNLWLSDEEVRQDTVVRFRRVRPVDPAPEQDWREAA